MNEQAPALRLEGIVKTFPGVRALDGVSFSVLPGEVHALMGENGAGKSTLMKVLGGIYQPDEGRIIVAEEPVTMRSPLEAKAKGIVFIHQELSLAEELTVAENIYLGELPRKRFGLVDWKRLFERTDAILEKLKVGFDARTIVGTLSIANQQMVEIARALTVDAKAVIFDEPTASLTDAEKVVLFDVIADLKAQGVGIIYISHRMEEIFRITDRISVLRDGQYRGTLNTAETNEDDVTQLMIGRKLDLSRNASQHELGDIAIEVRNLSCGDLFQDVSFHVRRGEVVGFYGLVGAGRTEIARTIVGADPRQAGRVLLQGEEIVTASVREGIAHGLGYITEDRKGEGLVLGLSIEENVTLPNLRAIARGMLIDRRRSQAMANECVERLKVRTPSVAQAVANLSGGNQQKVVIGKWLARNCRVLIFDEPTRGVDIGARAEIYSIIEELAEAGVGILVISSDLPELLGLSDRVLVVHQGRLAAEFSRQEATPEKVISVAFTGEVA